jgi:hypothetical protein
MNMDLESNYPDISWDERQGGGVEKQESRGEPVAHPALIEGADA